MSRFFAVKTTANQERVVANLMDMAARKHNLNVYSILAPKETQRGIL